MHNIKSALIGLLIGVVILLGIGISISIIYEEEVSLYLIEELNEYLLSEIEVGSVNLTVIKKFPKASIEFKDVLALTKPGYQKKINGVATDTLFYAKNLSVQINLLDLFSKKYIVKGVHFDKGKINLFIDRYGDPNYIFWDTSIDKGAKEFELDLNQVKITNCDVFFGNQATNFNLKTVVKRIDFQGNFSNQNYLMKVKSDMFVKLLEVNGVNYIKNKHIKSNSSIDIFDKNIKITEGKFNFNNLTLDLNGEYDYEDNQSVDFSFSGRNLNMKSFVNNLPQSIKNEISQIDFVDGNISLNINVAGSNLKTNNPNINALFIINNAELNYLERELEFKNASLEGEYSNGNNKNVSTSSIKFKNFRTNISNNLFNGSFEIYNFSDPQIKFDIGSELYLHEIKEIFSIDTLEILSGYAESEIKYSGSYQDLKNIRLPDLFTKEYTISIKLYGCDFKIKDNPLLISGIAGGFKINKTLESDSLAFNIRENDFLINGQAIGLYDYFLLNEPFNINAFLVSRKINLNELAPLFKVNKESKANSSYKFPDNISLDLNLNIQNFEAGKFNATDIRGDLNYKPKMFSLHEVSFNSMNGKVKVGGVIIQKFNNNFLVRTQSRLSGININKLFYSFNNFGQNFISNQNLEGDLTGNVYFTSEWNDKIEIDRKTAQAECDFTLIDGELNNFEPMLGLSRFIDIDELKQIQFSEFKNTIRIKDEQIVIPQMDIVSSVMNVTASGKHGFDGNYEYHVSLLLSDLLSAKMKRSKKNKSFSDVEEDKDGRLMLHLLLEGDHNDFNVKRDRSIVRRNRNENLKEEKSELKKIFNEEFGLFKNDSSVKNRNIKIENEEKFKIEFEDEKPKEKKKKESKPVQNQKFIIEWDEDTTSVK